MSKQIKDTDHLAGIPIIMLTGDSRHQTVTSSIQAGASDFLVKPFTRRSLKEKLDRAIAGAIGPDSIQSTA